MTTLSPVINYPNPSMDTSFVKNMVKVLKVGTTAGTLVASFGLNNVQSYTPILDQSIQDMKNHFEGVIQLSNGTEITLLPTFESSKKNHHNSVDERIDLKGLTEIDNIMLWTETSREAIILNYSKPPLYKFENTYKSRLVDEGIIETTPIEFDDNIVNSSLDDSNLYKFEKGINSKVIIAGDYLTTPIEWD